MSGEGTDRDLHSIHCDIHSGEACSHETRCPPPTPSEIREIFGPGVDAHANLMRQSLAEARGVVTSAPEACTPWCSNVDHFYACPNYVMPELERKRRALQAKLDGVRVDTAKLKNRTPRRRVHVVGIEARTMIAKEILLAMVGNGGDKLDKVRAAVEYTDLLLSELGGGIQPFGGDDE